jgi:protease IV
VSINYYEPEQPNSHSSPSGKKPSRIRQFFSVLGASISWIRNTMMNLFFITLLIVIFVAIGSNAPQPLPASFALTVAPTGVLVDQRSYIDPTSLLLAEEDPRDSETVVSDVTEAINHAAKDDRVKLLVLELDYLLGGGISKMNEIGQALENFKAANKKVIAVSDYYSQGQYYLASFANEIYLHDMGLIEITGLARYQQYYKSALDKLGITIHPFRSGKYKDFLEPYLRDDMSTESREHNAQWLNEIWTRFTAHIEKARGLDANSINDYINNLNSHMKTTQGDSAQLALEKKLVDKIVSRQERETILIELAGKKENPIRVQDIHHGDEYNGVDVKSYLADIRKHPVKTSNKIAVLTAVGNIVDGYQPNGTIGSESTVELLRQVSSDDDVKALVIRIDSGGGSAFASEIIRSDILALRKKNIPVFISMGSVAASGGYWIATAGDQIWAQPSTITGSIGVFGAFPTIEKTLNKIGITTDGLGTTELAGSMRIDRPLSDKAQQVLQLSVDNIYDKFITLVADARKQEKTWLSG